MEPKIEIVDIQHHRNGVMGEPFYAITFTEEGSRKVATVFQANWHVAVLDIDLLAAGNITFGENSWRGDNYAPQLRAAIAAKYGEPEA
jgi:hypothetical protein